MPYNSDNGDFKSSSTSSNIHAQRRNIPDLRLSPPKRGRSSSPTRRSGSPDRRLQIAQLERERGEKIWPSNTKRIRLDQDETIESKFNQLDEKWLAKLDALEKLYIKKIEEMGNKIKVLETRIDSMVENE